MSNYPPQIEIAPLTKVPHATVRVPGSKSITNRALVLDALTSASHGNAVVLGGVLESEDTEVMVQSLRRLGYYPVGILDCTQSDDQNISANKIELFVANSGTSMRFLTVVAALGRGRV